MELNANFSLPAAKPPVQRIGAAGWDAKIFSADSAPQLPPAPTVEQLQSRPFAPEMLRFYLTKRQARLLGMTTDGRERWRYMLYGKAQEVMLPAPQDAPEIERVAVEAIAATEGIEPDKARLYVAQVVTANWHDFMRSVDEAQQPMPKPVIPSFLQNILNHPPTLLQTPPASAQVDATSAEKYAPATPAAAAPESAPEAQTGGQDSSARGFLDEAAALMVQRGREYDRITGFDEPGLQERSMSRTVAAFNALHGTHLTTAQGWSFMLCLKLVRLFTAQGFHRDSAADGVAYMALLAEGKASES